MTYHVHLGFRLLPPALYSRPLPLSFNSSTSHACLPPLILRKPSAQGILYCVDSPYTEADALQAAKYVLRTIQQGTNYLRRVLGHRRHPEMVVIYDVNQTEIDCIKWRLIEAPSSLLIAMSILLAMLVLEKADSVSSSSCLSPRQ